MIISVDKATGIGPKTTAFLKKNHIMTIEALIQRGTDILAKAPGFSEARAKKVVNEAAKLMTTSSVKSALLATKSVPGKAEKKSRKSDKKKDKKGKSKKEKRKKNNKKK